MIILRANSICVFSGLIIKAQSGSFLSEASVRFLALLWRGRREMNPLLTILISKQQLAFLTQDFQIAILTPPPPSVVAFLYTVQLEFFDTRMLHN